MRPLWPGREDRDRSGVLAPKGEQVEVGEAQRSHAQFSNALSDIKGLGEPFFGTVQVAVPQQAKAQVENGPTDVDLRGRFFGCRQGPSAVSRISSSIR